MNVSVKGFALTLSWPGKFLFHPKIGCFNFKPQYLLNYSSPKNDFYSVRKRSIRAFKSIFRSRKNFSTTYAIVLFFFCFFSPDLFMKISNFSKTVHTIFTKFCTVILHPKGPLRVQRHQNRMAWM